MYQNIFPDFEDDSRIWIYGFNRKLNRNELDFVKKQLEMKYILFCGKNFQIWYLRKYWIAVQLYLI